MDRGINKMIEKLNAYSEQNGDKDKKNKEVALVVNLPRHPLMAAVENENFKKQKKEVLLDAELGLKNQCAIDTIELLRNDIDELTSSAKYYEVDENILNRLFKIGLLKLQCLPYNFNALIGSIFKVIKTSVICLIGMFSCIAVIVWRVSNTPIQSYTAFSQGAFWYFALIVVMAIIVFVFLIFSFSKLGVRSVSKDKNDTVIKRTIKFEFEFLTVRLKNERLQETRIKIPYGAKLKLKEAKDTSIFEDFKIVYPGSNLEHTEKTFIFSRKLLDPAIIGITSDNRMYMIVYWDVQKDVEKTLKDIKTFTKFKLGNKR